MINEMKTLHIMTRITLLAVLASIPFTTDASQPTRATTETAIAIYRGIDDSNAVRFKFRMPDRKIRHFTIDPANADVCRLQGGFGRNYRITFDPQRNRIVTVAYLSREAEEDAQRIGLARSADPESCIARLHHEMHED